MHPYSECFCIFENNKADSYSKITWNSKHLHCTTYLYNQRITNLPIIPTPIASGRYNKGTKKYVSASLGGSGFSAGDDVSL